MLCFDAFLEASLKIVTGDGDIYQMLFSADGKGYVKAWDLTTCHFEKKSTEPSSTPMLFDFRAHHEPLVSYLFNFQLDQASHLQLTHIISSQMTAPRNRH